MSSLNFLTRKCPNEQYGCGFFVTRLHPLLNNNKSKIVFSRLSNSFGHQSIDNFSIDKSESKENDRIINLIDLPFHTLLKVVNYLDAFSINNLSLTCKFFRFLVSNSFQNKGLVNLIWQKFESSDQPDASEWKIIGYKWSFSNSIDEVKEWTFDGDHKMLNHIPNCKYIDRAERKEPYKLIGLGSRIQRR